jgi:hypothetical protein
MSTARETALVRFEVPVSAHKGPLEVSHCHLTRAQTPIPGSAAIAYTPWSLIAFAPATFGRSQLPRVARGDSRLGAVWFRSRLPVP